MTAKVLSSCLSLLALLLVCEFVMQTSQEERCVYLDHTQHLDSVGLSMDGDVVIGVLINFYMQPPDPDLSFIEEPYLPACYE